MAVTRPNSELPPVQIGERLRSILYVELIRIATEHKHCRDRQGRQGLQDQYEAISGLIFAASSNDRQAQLAAR
jgi:hypothetical protein